MFIMAIFFWGHRPACHARQKRAGEHGWTQIVKSFSL